MPTRLSLLAQRSSFAGGRSGFTLITMSILLTVAALVFVSVLPGQQAGDVNQKTINDIKKLDKVEAAMRAFMAFNGRRPCPADGSYDINNANFGVEAATPGTCTVTSGMLGPDAGTGYIVGGTIPTKSLGLPDDYAFDEYGRRFTYVVDTRATSASTCPGLQRHPFNNGVGGILIETSSTGGTVLDSVMAAYVSHGPDGHGAFPPQGSATTGRFNTGSTDQDENTNAGASNDGNMTYSTANFTNVLIKKDRTSTFDHLVYYRPDIKDTCCLGQACYSTPGFRIDGTIAGQNSGNSLAVGDVNGDGIPDLIIAAPTAPGHVYVVFGTRNGFPNPLPLNTLNGTNGFTITENGDPSNALGFSVAAGDLNADGFADVVMNDKNSTFVLFGHANPWPATVDVSTLNDGVAGTTFSDSNGGGGYQIMSYTMTTADVNGDGIADLIMTDFRANNDNGTEAVEIYFGHTGAWPGSFDIGTLPGDASATNGVFISGQGGWLGHEHNLAAGDVNGDGVADIAVGATHVGWVPPPGNGVLYVIFGCTPANCPTYWPTLNNHDLTVLDGTNGFRMYDSNTGYGPDYWPNSLAVADVDGDGIADIIFTAGYANSVVMGCNAAPGNDSRVAYILWGNNSWGSATYDFESLRGTSAATAICLDVNGGSEISGVGAVDINNDGIPDVVIDASTFTTPDAHGSTYLLFGGAGLKATTMFDVAVTPLDGSNGFRIDHAYSGDELFGGFAGLDINGDGNQDIAIGLPNGSGSGQSTSGYTYVIFGKPSGWTSPFNLSTIY